MRKSPTPATVQAPPTTSPPPPATKSKATPPLPPPTYRSTDDKVAAYLYTYGAVAQQEMRLYKIPASITLAQGLLESGFGQGRLAVEANNHFGIKCHSGWSGGRIYHDDDELGECFRVYADAAASYRDHSLFLVDRSRYAFLFDLGKKNYKAWAKGLKKAGYATDPKYPDKLIRLIERYALDRFDQSASVEVALPQPSVPSADTPVYVVQKGDTLYGIARKLQVDVSTLKRLNKLKDNTIYLGQELQIPTKK